MTIIRTPTEDDAYMVELAKVGAEAVNALMHEDVIKTTNDTMQSVFNSLTSEQKDAAALIFGAIVSGETEIGPETFVTNDKTLGEIYDSLSLTEKAVIDFIAGGIEPEITHEDVSFIESVLEHHGVKGQKWGVIRSNRALSGSSSNTSEGRKAARTKVKANTATLGEAHLAAMKSTGHRVANAFLGDKTYWKRTGIITAVGLVGVGASLAAPAVLPTTMLTHLGVHAIAGGAFGSGHAVTVAGYTVTTKAAALAAGKQAATAIGLGITYAGAQVASGVNAVNAIGRAVTANTRINRSYEKLGEHISAHQSMGSKRVQRLLKASGAKIKHAEEDVSAIAWLDAGIKFAENFMGNLNDS